MSILSLDDSSPTFYVFTLMYVYECVCLHVCMYLLPTGVGCRRLQMVVSHLVVLGSKPCARTASALTTDISPTSSQVSTNWNYTMSNQNMGSF